MIPHYGVANVTNVFWLYIILYIHKYKDLCFMTDESNEKKLFDFQEVNPMQAIAVSTFSWFVFFLNTFSNV